MAKTKHNNKIQKQTKQNQNQNRTTRKCMKTRMKTNAEKGRMFFPAMMLMSQPFKYLSNMKKYDTFYEKNKNKPSGLTGQVCKSVCSKKT